MSGSPPKLLCFPCAGASATGSFAGWRRLGELGGIDVIPLELSGRGSRIREPPLTNFEALAADLAERSEQATGGDYVLFGHSFGALAAYACARILRARHRHPPLALVVACCAAPNRVDAERYRADWSRDRLRDELIEMNGTPEAALAHPEMLQIAVDQLGADYEALGSFRWEPDAHALEVPMLVLGGSEDTIAVDALEDWRLMTTADVTVEMLAGGHFFPVQAPALTISRIRDYLGARVPATRALVDRGRATPLRRVG